jgi:hypothetical protein
VTRTTILVIAAVIVVAALGIWLYMANQPRPIISVEAGGTSVKVDSGGIDVTVQKAN